MMNYKKYKPVPIEEFKERTWPDRKILRAPQWCSVDLRDGNQALVEPMNVEEKMEFFDLLLKLGFKEIEIGFPAASQIEFDFLRKLVEEDRIPDDVRVQVLTQCREHLIDRTFEAIEGIPNVVFHIYNSTSTLQREAVFHMSREEIKRIAVEGTEMVKKRLSRYKGNLVLEYSPESFMGTELEYALDVCTAVQDAWDYASGDKIIMNLPNTVEQTTPNVYADQIEWMSRSFKDRDKVVLSIHPHNDRGCGVAATELALLAGADRVEGTLLGNGERTGNVDILTVAYNMFSQGVNPKLNLENINDIIEVYERCCKMRVDPRHPYAGKLVFTAFSGSHQDAIKKGIRYMEDRDDGYWEVPYLPIDPTDLGRKYEPIVRINSQSGKGGVAFVMEQSYGYSLPKEMQREFADVIQKLSEERGEIAPSVIMDNFRAQYLELTWPYEFLKAKISEGEDNDMTEAVVTFKYQGIEHTTEAVGNGPVDAVRNAVVSQIEGLVVTVNNYWEHALSEGSHAKAAAYIEMRDDKTSRVTFGVGVSGNITRATIRAMFSALNRLAGPIE
ncbi:MAG: 2-isopropylmalate synthase [Lachnospiraceae bacterium]|nr:2-isopropylmalate synthase [Lachnospiraceae bacterium]